jgi:hypothetical protein
MVHCECANGELLNASLQNSQTPDGHSTHRDCLNSGLPEVVPFSPIPMRPGGINRIDDANGEKPPDEWDSSGSINPARLRPLLGCRVGQAGSAIPVRRAAVAIDVKFTISLRVLNPNCRRLASSVMPCT